MIFISFRYFNYIDILCIKIASVIPEWFEINKIEEKLSYQNLKDVWKEIKPKGEAIIKK